jgi:hypothetical protein
MSRSRQRLGLLAFAFDAPGRDVLNALTAHPDIGEAQVHCYHAVEQTGQESRLAWYRRAPEGWAPFDPARVQGDPAKAFELAVRAILDIDHLLTPERTIDFLDIVLINPISDPYPAPLPVGIVEALCQVRRRFSKVARILLFAEGSFETAGASSAPGRLHPLPYVDGSDSGTFDLIILFDRLNLQGMVMNDAAEATRYVAAILATLTLSELAPTLFNHLQAEQARMREGSRYAALGLAEWRLRDRGVAAAAAFLFHQMARELLDDPASPVVEAADPWIEKVEAEVFPTADKAIDPVALSTALDAEGWEDLRSLFRVSGWVFPRLVRLVERRHDALGRIAARSRVRLARFMELRFARWYAAHQLGRHLRGAPEITETREPRYGRIALCAGAALGGAGSLAAAFATSYQAVGWGGAAAFGLAAGLVARRGLTRIERHVWEMSSPPDLLPELQRLRALDWLAASLRRRAESAAAVCQETVALLEREVESAPAESPKAFPFSTEVCAALLDRKKITPWDCLHRFWDDGAAFERVISGSGLTELLREHARRCCAPIANLEWSDVFLASAGLASGDGFFWKEALKRAREASIPWVPVPGSSPLHTFLALPHNLPADNRRTLVDHFPDQKSVKEIDGNEILVVQLSQGYREVVEP